MEGRNQGYAKQTEENQKEENRIGRVEGDVRGMEGGGIVGGGAEERYIGHERNPKQGNIDGGVVRAGGKCALEGVQGKARKNQIVLSDIRLVIQRHETIMDGWSEEGENDEK